MALRTIFFIASPSQNSSQTIIVLVWNYFDISYQTFERIGETGM